MPMETGRSAGTHRPHGPGGDVRLGVAYASTRALPPLEGDNVRLGVARASRRTFCPLPHPTRSNSGRTASGEGEVRADAGLRGAGPGLARDVGMLSPRGTTCDSARPRIDTHVGPRGGGQRALG